MSSARRVQSQLLRVWTSSLAVFVMTGIVACSNTPTAPTRHADPTAIAPGLQESPPVPPRLHPLPPAAALGATRIVAFGDSITYGTLSSFDGRFLFDAPSHSYPSRVLLALQNTFPSQAARFVVVNAGSPGERAAEARNRLQSVLQAQRPDALLLLEGINDMTFGSGHQQAAAAVVELVQTARLYNATVLLGLMPQTYPSTYPNGEERSQAAEKVVPFNNELRRLTAGLQNVHIVDLHALFGSNRTLMGGDGLHPTLAGYEAMASGFVQVLENVFPVRGRLE